MPSHSARFVFAMVALCATASAGVVFGPVRGKAGESVRLVTKSETPDGNIRQTLAGKSTAGRIFITRERDLVWTFRDPAADGSRRGMVKVAKISTHTKTVIDGKTENIADDSPLASKMFTMSKTPKGDWKFELDGSVPLTRVQKEIDELKVYLKRDWYPARELNLGDSWEFDPAWVKMLVERDFPEAHTIGTMRLRQIRQSLLGKSAVIDINIHSTGGDFKADGRQSGGAVELTGQVTVNLETMLDEALELKGTVTTNSSKGTDITWMKLPVHITVTKSFVKNPAWP